MNQNKQEIVEITEEEKDIKKDHMLALSACCVFATTLIISMLQ